MKASRRSCCSPAAVVGLLLTAFVLCFFCLPAQAETRPTDFNGDGFDDLAVGVHFEDFGDVKKAGAVNVFYGSVDGIATLNSRLFQQDSDGILGISQRNDYFGRSLASGDFDGDGNYDLAVGIPGEKSGGKDGVGMVTVIYGTSKGLTHLDNQKWTQKYPDIKGQPAAGDSFGKSLAAGDFNGDGYDDLAIGSPCEDGGGFRNSGAVNVIYGSEDGLTSAGNQYWHQDKPGIKGMREPGDFFGNTLAAGDFDDDDYDDLVVGVSAEDVGTRRNAGAVNVIYGSEDGLTSAGNQMWHQNKRGIRGGAERGDHFGRSLAVGDFNRDYYDDLVIGVPYENIGRKRDMGAMHVLYGSGLGLTDSEGYDEWWHPMQPWFVDTFALQPTIAESFAYALAAGDFNNDNCSDLAIGIPFWNSERYNDVGKVFVVYGHPLLGLQLNWRNFFSWPPLGTESAWVGYSLTTGDYNYDDYDDLVIGMPKADISGQENSGAVHVLWGSPTGLNYTDMQYRHQDSTDVEDQCEGGDLFGRSLAR